MFLFERNVFVYFVRQVLALAVVAFATTTITTVVLLSTLANTAINSEFKRSISRLMMPLQLLLLFSVVVVVVVVVPHLLLAYIFRWEGILSVA